MIDHARNIHAFRHSIRSPGFHCQDDLEIPAIKQGRGNGAFLVLGEINGGWNVIRKRQRAQVFPVRAG